MQGIYIGGDGGYIGNILFWKGAYRGHTGDIQATYREYKLCMQFKDEGNTNLYWMWAANCLGNTYQV